MWWILALLATALFMAGVVLHTVRQNRPYREEAARYAHLALHGRTAEAEVLSLKELAQGVYENDVELRLHTGLGQERLLRTRIARELVVNFMPGRRIQVLVDPRDPAALAIDRRRSPTSIPR